MNILEIKRQIFHWVFGVFIVILLMYGFIDQWILFYLIILGLIVSFLSKKMKIPVIYWFLENFERPKDLKKFPGKGVISYLMGAFLVTIFFPLEIAMASIMILAFGDSVSHIFGIHYGKRKHLLNDKKFIEGSIAGLTAAFMGALIFLPWFEALAASLIAMIVEAFEIKMGREQIDDNIVMPLVAAIVITVIGLF
jgi:dolichol kinase